MRRDSRSVRDDGLRPCDGASRDPAPADQRDRALGGEPLQRALAVRDRPRLHRGRRAGRRRHRRARRRARGRSPRANAACQASRCETRAARSGPSDGSDPRERRRSHRVRGVRRAQSRLAPRLCAVSRAERPVRFRKLGNLARGAQAARPRRARPGAARAQRID